MGFKLTATIADKNTPRTPPEIYLSTIGTKEGEEVTDANCPDGILDTVREAFKRMAKKYEGKPKPLTLSWFPLTDKKLFFQNLKKKQLRITVFIEKYDKSAKWTWFFDGVEMNGDPKPAYKKFKDHTRQDERVDVTFKLFDYDPK